VKELAVALKVAVDIPDATVTDEGTLKSLLPLWSVTARPPAPAADVSVNVQLVDTPGAIVEGEQANLEIDSGDRLIVVVCTLFPSVARTVAL
jgi:hypothetical protein